MMPLSVTNQRSNSNSRTRPMAAGTDRSNHATAIGARRTTIARASVRLSVTRLPDFHAILWRQVKRIGRLNIEGLVPLRHVANRTVGAVNRRRVGVGRDAAPQLFVADDAAPDLAEAEVA